MHCLHGCSSISALKTPISDPIVNSPLKNCSNHRAYEMFEVLAFHLPLFQRKIFLKVHYAEYNTTFFTALQLNVEEAYRCFFGQTLLRRNLWSDFGSSFNSWICFYCSQTDSSSIVVFKILAWHGWMFGWRRSTYLKLSRYT